MPGLRGLHQDLDKILAQKKCKKILTKISLPWPPASSSQEHPGRLFIRPLLRHWHLQDFPCKDGLERIFLGISTIFCRTSRTTRTQGSIFRGSGACLKSRKDQIKRTAPTSSKKKKKNFARACAITSHINMSQEQLRARIRGKKNAPQER